MDAAAPPLLSLPNSISAADLDHCDFLAIDDFLDFPIVDIDATAAAADAHSLSSACCISYASSSNSNDTSSASSSSSSSAAAAAAALPHPPPPPPLDQLQHYQSPPFASDDLCVPSDDLTDLEWLSSFVDASFSSGDAPGNYSLHDLASESNMCDYSCGEAAELQEGGGARAGSGVNLSAVISQSASPVSVLQGGGGGAHKSPSSWSSSTSMHMKGRLDMDEFEDQGILFDNIVFPSSPSSDAAAGNGVTGRARSKRGRSGICFWNTRILSHEASESILLQESSAAAAAATARHAAVFSSAFYDEEDDGDENSNGGGGEDSDTTDDEEYYGDGDEEEEKPRLAQQMHYERRQTMKRRGNGAAAGGGGGGGWRKGKKGKKDDEGSEMAPPPPPLRKRRGPAGAAAAAEMRKCLHCATQKTPQWRAGPMGPKTLCNACGVRYKSGRLCPEYRPAASPTFVDTLHSNSHRKVMEMRRQKGFLLSAAISPASAPPGKRIQSADASPGYYAARSASPAEHRLSTSFSGGSFMSSSCSSTAPPCRTTAMVRGAGGDVAADDENGGGSAAECLLLTNGMSTGQEGGRCC